MIQTLKSLRLAMVIRSKMCKDTNTVEAIELWIRELDLIIAKLELKKLNKGKI